MTSQMLGETNDRWQNAAKDLLRTEMKRRGVSYEDLAHLMKDIGLVESSRALTNKVSRGTFSTAFFLQCMTALGVKSLVLP